MSRKSNGTQLIKYVLRYAMKENFDQRKSDATIIVSNHIKSNEVTKIINEFKINESFRIYRRKDAVKLYHDVISTSPQSKKFVTTDILQAIATKYIELRANNTLSIAIKHDDRPHAHIHVLTAGVKLDGYSSRVSKQQFRHIKLELEKFQQQQYPQLSASITKHKGKTAQTKEEVIEAVKNSRQKNKHKLTKVLQQTFTQAYSKEDFLARLQQQNYQPYFRNEQLQGVLVDGRKFRFSGLGYGEAQFKELEEREKMEAAVLEIDELRKGKIREQIKESEPYKIASTKEQSEDLQELDNLRKRGALSRGQERVIDIDSDDLPNVIAPEIS